MQRDTGHNQPSVRSDYPMRLGPSYESRRFSAPPSGPPGLAWL